MAQVTVADALNTPYGITLIAKVALVLPLLFLGALNLLWVRPRLRREDSSLGWLKRLLIGEAVLAVLILAAVGMLTALEPARQVASRELADSRQSISFSDTVSGDTIQLEVSPGRVGSNDVTVTLTDRLAVPSSTPTRFWSAGLLGIRLGRRHSDGYLTRGWPVRPRGCSTKHSRGVAGRAGGAPTGRLRRPHCLPVRGAGYRRGRKRGDSPSPETAYLLLAPGYWSWGLCFSGPGCRWAAGSPAQGLG